MKIILKKLNKTSGYTLAETLMTVLILLMVSGVVAGGIPAAVNAYGKAVDAANAHALLSTTINALRDEFSTAWSIECKNDEDNTVVAYYSSDTGARTRLYMGTDKNNVDTIMIQDYLAFDTDAFAEEDKIKVQLGTDNPPHTLVTTSAVTKKMKVTYDSVTWFGDTDHSGIVFHNLKVTKNTNGADTTEPAVAEISELKIRILSTNLLIPEAASSGGT